MAGEKAAKVPRAAYERELLRLQTELVKFQEWVRTEGSRLVIVFEGRDAAGKGGTIKRVSEQLNPQVARTAALPKPTERERGQWYFQRYVEHLPAAAEIVLFDRSWYNRAGVEHVMGFCTKEEYQLFLRQCPVFERMLIEDGVLLRKYWFSVSDAAQQERFSRRLEDPTRRWKLSPRVPPFVQHLSGDLQTGVTAVGAPRRRVKNVVGQHLFRRLAEGLSERRAFIAFPQRRVHQP